MTFKDVLIIVLVIGLVACVGFACYEHGLNQNSNSNNTTVVNSTNGTVNDTVNDTINDTSNVTIAKNSKNVDENGEGNCYDYKTGRYDASEEYYNAHYDDYKEQANREWREANPDIYG